MSLLDYLIKWGWLREDAERAVAAFDNGGIEAAVLEVAWMDEGMDGQSDYQGEMRDAITQWEGGATR